MFLNLKSVWRFFPAVDGNILFVFKFSGGPIFYLGFSGGAAISLTFDCFSILTRVSEIHFFKNILSAFWYLEISVEYFILDVV